MKKIMSVFAALFLTMAVCMCACADDAVHTSGDYEYYIDNDGNAIICGYRGDAKDVIVPSLLDSHPVVALGDLSFNSPSAVSVLIPDTVISIGEWAFCGCDALSSVEIPNSVTDIGRNPFVFHDVSIKVRTDHPVLATIDGVLFNKITKTLIYCPRGLSGTYTIPDGILEIGCDAFMHCDYITSVKIPMSVKTIDESAFAYCQSLVSVEIPNSVTTLCGWVFYNCPSLTSVILPNSIVAIEEYTFGGCTSLTHVEIPESVVTIGDEAFQECKSLISVEIPSHVSSIGNEAFYYCLYLESVTLPLSVTSIGEEAFNTLNNKNYLTLKVFPDSYAEKYAKENDFTYKYIEDTSWLQS